MRNGALRFAAVAVLSGLLASCVSAPPVSPSDPVAGPVPAPGDPPGRFARLAFVGDTGTGRARARRVAAAMRLWAESAPLSHVFFVGDNVYEEGDARLIGPRFLDVYRPVFSRGAEGHAALGNHDVQHCRDSGRRPVPRDGAAYADANDCWAAAHLTTPEFGYEGGHRYYSVVIPGNPGAAVEPRLREAPVPDPLVEVFVLDTNTLGRDQNRLDRGTDEPQLDWLDAALAQSRARWKVVASHHPVYAPARCRWLWFGCRGDDEVLRAQLEPIFAKHGVNVVFQGHQHLYARMRPQRGVRYFVTGAGGKRPDSFRPDRRTLPRTDRGAFNHFVVVTATESAFGYQVVDADGTVRDHGSFPSGEDSGLDSRPLPERRNAVILPGR